MHTGKAKAHLRSTRRTMAMTVRKSMTMKGNEKAHAHRESEGPP